MVTAPVPASLICATGIVAVPDDKPISLSMFRVTGAE
jgi:hypothetical protein